MNPDEIALIAQNISFAFEDHFNDEVMNNKFNDLFNKYLADIDPEGAMEPYDAIKALGRKDFGAFERMVKEMKEQSLISD